jgi:uncharacterized protein (DUF433 family)
MTIKKSPDVLGGKPRIDGHRIGVHHIVNAIWYEGVSAEWMVEAVYPQITEEDIFEALNYYHSHRDEIEEIRERSAQPADMEITRPEDLPENLQ